MLMMTIISMPDGPRPCNPEDAIALPHTQG